MLQNLKFRNEYAANDKYSRNVPTTDGNRAIRIVSQSNTVHPLTSLQRLMYGVALVGGEWAWNRLNRLSVINAWSERAPDDWRRRAWVLMSRLETAYKLASIVNFVVFLYDSKYVSLLTRLLGMRLVYARPSMTRRVSFEYMNRQLVWQGFTEFLLFLMPLISLGRIRGFISRKLSKTLPNFTTNSSGALISGINSAGLSSIHSSSSSSFHHSGCPACNSEAPTTPYLASCGHIFCYYCIKAGSMADSQYPCPKCGSVITTMKRYQPN